MEDLLQGIAAPALTKQAEVFLKQGVAQARRIEIAQDAASAIGAVLRSQARVVQVRANRRRQRFRVVNRDQKTGLAVAYGVDASWYPRRDDGQPHRRRFQERRGEPFAIRRED